jgi:hypothetical protein
MVPNGCPERLVNNKAIGVKPQLGTSRVVGRLTGYGIPRSGDRIGNRVCCGTMYGVRTRDRHYEGVSARKSRAELRVVGRIGEKRLCGLDHRNMPSRMPPLFRNPPVMWAASIFG